MIKYIGKCLLIEEEGEKLLIVGDLHLGYEEALNQTGVFVSRTLFKEVLKEFDEIFGEIGNVDKVILLGDVKHDFGGILKQEWNDILDFIDYLNKRTKEVIITIGNHDTFVRFIANKRKINIADYYIWKDYFFAHGDKDYPEIWDNKIKTIVIGHAHPAVRLKEGVKEEKYKCFLEGEFKGKKWIILPSFLGASEGSDPRDGNNIVPWNIRFGNFEVYVIGEKLEVLNFGKLKDLQD